MKKAITAALLVTASLVALSGPSVAQLTQSRADTGERRICRMMNETGKLAAGRRVCLTRAEWDRAAEEQRKVAQSMVNSVNSCASTANGGGGAAISAPAAGTAMGAFDCR